MKKNEVLKLIDERRVDLKSVIATLKVSDNNKNTRNTQLYAKRKDCRIIELIESLVKQLGDDVKLSDSERSTLILLTTLSSEHSVRGQVVCNEGDDIISVLQKYADVKNVSEKLNKYCEKNDLVLNYATGKVEAAK